MKRTIVNMDYFLETMAADVVAEALENFYNEEDDGSGIIVSNYDDNGYCIFKQVEGDIYKFTGTAK